MHDKSKASEATHIHRNNGRKIDPDHVPGVSIVTDRRTGKQKIAVASDRAAGRLLQELRLRR